MAEVKLLNVTKVYNSGSVAVKNVNITVNDGEFLVLVGPTGCGKSTILRMIAGLEEITSGELYIDGKLMNNVPPSKRDIAMVFQNYALYPHMTVYDNIAFGLKLRKYSRDEIKKKVLAAAKILGLENFLDKKPKELSGGQKQRVAVGRAIVRNPKVFLFDEPLSNLDAKMRVMMRAEISKLHREIKGTTIYVTHDQVEAMTMGDRIVILKDGEVQQIDTPLNLYKYPVNKFVAGFIGSPSMNFLEGEIVNGSNIKFRSLHNSISINLENKEDSKLSEYINKKVFLGVRPEHIIIDNTRYDYECSIDLVEPMGNELFIYFKVEDTNFVAKSFASEIPQVGTKIKISFDPQKLYFFDYESGLAIY